MLHDNDCFEHEGHTFRVRFPADEDSDPPWENSDGHGPVSDWTRRAKRPGERVLNTDHGSNRYYDWHAALELAKRDQWGTADGQRQGETIGKYRTRAVELDFQFLRGWCLGEWHYCGVVVTLVDADGRDSQDSRERESLWGIEDNAAAYLESTAHELADEIISRIEVDEPDVQLSEN